MTLREPFQIVRLDGVNGALVHDAMGDLALLNEIAQTRGFMAVIFVIVSGHPRPPRLNSRSARSRATGAEIRTGGANRDASNVSSVKASYGP
jgi:hypothetical protein